MADPDTDRDQLEVLAADYMDRLRQGQRPSVEEYASRHPELAEEIRELFPTIAVTERLKARQARSSGGRVTLGPAQLERLGDFRIIREIGRGGMGVVFEAEQESLGRRVAVKVLPRQALLDEKHLKRFQREARIAANLHHTNIVEIFGVGEQDGFHYYVMQYIRGVGLDAVIPVLAKLAPHHGNIPLRPSTASTTSAISENATAEAAVSQQAVEGGPPDRRGGPGGQGGFHLLPPLAQEQLNLTANEQRQLAALEAEVKVKLGNILTPEQLQRLNQLQPPQRQGGPRGGGRGTGGPGMEGPGMGRPGMGGPPDAGLPGGDAGDYHFVDVHGAGAQRSDPKAGNPAMFPHGRGPQGDVIRIYNYVRLVRVAAK